MLDDKAKEEMERLTRMLEGTTEKRIHSSKQRISFGMHLLMSGNCDLKSYALLWS